MRENIGLFRGKRIDNGEWVEGWLIDYRPYREWVAITAFVDGSDGYTWRRLEIEVDPNSIGECTSLKDKNGKLIFEGDILRDVEACWGEVTEVKFCTEDVGSCGCCYPQFEGSGFVAAGVLLSWCEIIGNIHDNPELLKGGEGL